MKIKRLLKEITELSTEVEGVRNLDEADSASDQKRQVFDMSESLHKIIEAKNSGFSVSTVTKILATKSEQNGESMETAAQQSIQEATPRTRASTLSESRALELDARLATLERALGSTSSITFNNTFNTTVFELQVIPTLLSLSQKITSLTTSPEKLQAIVAAAKENLPAEKQSGTAPGGRLTAVSKTASSDKISTTEKEKIDAVYASLGAVEKLTQIMPSLLDRLKSLQYIHAEAGQIVGNVDELRKALVAAESDVSKWKATVDGAEKKLDELEEREKMNLEAVDKWLKELERRVAAL